ncbi:hypothetical protein AWB69_09083 [Caballeronia udeis]|uniref:Uncharacterized protein n=1 Tax=Caballeronia udeis TaxID=1232866 RepID=A0A158JYM0_9BURK|nr:hypothetical protein AWB69_09083 [Caballeronia udeis]
MMRRVPFSRSSISKSSTSSRRMMLISRSIPWTPANALSFAIPDTFHPGSASTRLRSDASNTPADLRVTTKICTKDTVSKRICLGRNRHRFSLFSYASSSLLEALADTLHSGQVMMTPPNTLARPAPVCASQLRKRMPRSSTAGGDDFRQSHVAHSCTYRLIFDIRQQLTESGC